MIVLDWLLRFHPIIIILPQSRSSWTPEAWLRRKLWLCVSQVSVALPAPIVTWSHARGQELSSNVHLTLRRKYLILRHRVILHAFTLIRTQTTNRQLNRAQITSENAVSGCWMPDGMEEGWSLPLPLHGQFGCQSPSL